MSDEEKREDYTGTKPKSSKKTDWTHNDRNCEKEIQSPYRNQNITPYEENIQAPPAQGDTFVNIRRATGITIIQPVILSNEKRGDLPPDNRRRSLGVEETVQQHAKNSSNRRYESTLEEEIAHLQTSLKNRIRRKDVFMPSLLWEDEELDYPIEDYFVELLVEEKDRTGAFVKRENIPLNQIFHSSHPESIRFKQNILIIGDAGFGKTTLTKKLSYDWAAPQSPRYISFFDMVVNIPLRTIGSRTMKQVVLDYLHLQPKENVTEDIISKRRMNWLVILDGFDELVSEENQQKLLSFLEQPNTYIRGFSENSAIVVTSRPYPVKKIRKYFDRYLSISGLSTENQKKYIQTLFKPDFEKADKVISVFQSNDFLKNVSECPLMLHMICCVYGKSSFASNIITLTSLYFTICELILKRFAKKRSECFDSAGLEVRKILIKLGKIASIYLKSVESFTEDVLRKMVPEEEERNNILGTGFLLASPKRYDMGLLIYYDFIHRTFAEFFEAIYLVDMISQNEETVYLDRCISFLILRDTTKAGFLFGILRENILLCESILERIQLLSISLETLVHIKKESGLSDEYWKMFSEHISKIEYTHNSKDRDLVLSGLGHLNIKCTGIEFWTEILNEEFWKRATQVLELPDSAVDASLKISLPFLYYFDGISHWEVYFENMSSICKNVLKNLTSRNCSFFSVCFIGTNNFAIPSCNFHLPSLDDFVIINSICKDSVVYASESPCPILCLMPTRSNNALSIILFDDILQNFYRQCLEQYMEKEKVPTLVRTKEYYRIGIMRPSDGIGFSSLRAQFPDIRIRDLLSADLQREYREFYVKSDLEHRGNEFCKTIRKTIDISSPPSSPINCQLLAENSLKYPEDKYRHIKIKYDLHIEIEAEFSLNVRVAECTIQMKFGR